MRRSLKEEKRLAAERRGQQELRFAKWSVSRIPLCRLGSLDNIARKHDANCSNSRNPELQDGKQGDVRNLAEANAEAAVESAAAGGTR